MPLQIGGRTGRFPSASFEEPFAMADNTDTLESVIAFPIFVTNPDICVDRQVNVFSIPQLSLSKAGKA